MPLRSWRFSLVAVLAAAVVAPRDVRAQLRPPPIPRSVHNWLGAEVGGAYVKNVESKQHAVEAVFRADIGTRVASHLVLDVDALLYARTDDARLVCPLDVAGSAPDCGTRLDYLPSEAITGTLGGEIGRAHDTPRLVVGAGVGAYGLHNGSGFFFGVHAMAKLVIADFGRMQLAATAQPLLLPNVPGGRLWALPITIGVRAH